MYFRNAKIFGEFVGAQWVDMGIDPYANLKNYRFVGADDPVRPAANLYPRNLKFIKIEIYRRLIP